MGKKNRNTGRENNNNKKRQENHKKDLKYIGAPYNFVPIPKVAYDYRKNNKREQPHNTIQEKLYTGSISYSVVARTPILSGGITNNGKTSCYKTASGKYAIQGSSMRGLIRSNLQILSFSSFKDDIDDYRLMYRNIMKKEKYGDILGAKQISVDGKNMSVLTNVRAGYLKKEDGIYNIYGTDKDKKCYEDGEMNYYVISERYILDNKEQFQYLYSDEFGTPLQYSKYCKFVRKEENKRVAYVPQIKKHFNGMAGGPYKPFAKEVSYKLDKFGRKVIAVGKPDDSKELNKGFLLGTGAMNQKKVLYIIPKIDENNSFQLDDASRKAFEIDYNNKKNGLGDAKDYYRLPEEGEEKPIFYIRDKETTYFGYTPRLRLFYDYSIKHGFRQEEAELDYARALFGYSTDNKAYKGRLYFTDAVTDFNGDPTNKTYIQSAPKPTSYYDYLIQEKDSKKDPSDYNNPNFQIRGIKQYWNKIECDPESESNGKERVTSSLEFLPEKTRFTGEIRFENLSKDELGLLLWSIEINENAYQNIGRAKAFGYGSVKISIDKLKILNTQNAYNKATLCLEPMEDKTGEIKGLVDAYKTHMKNWVKESLKKPDIESHCTVSNFISMKKNLMNNKLVRYMSIDNKEYQSRKEKLPTINEMVNKNKESHPNIKK